MLSKEALKLLDKEARVVPYMTGIKLEAPAAQGSKQLSQPRLYLQDLLDLNMSVYFLDSDSTTYCMNEYGATLCGFDSADDSVGRTLIEVAEIKTAHQLMQNSQRVSRTRTLQVFEERLVDLAGYEQTIFSIKFPWFNQKGQLLGSAGLSFNLQFGSMISSLQQLRQLGLFNPITSIVSTKPQELTDKLFTPRENDCAYWLIRGYSSKQIAQKLGLSFRTVEDYLGNMKNKMQVKSKQALIEKLIEINQG